LLALDLFGALDIFGALDVFGKDLLDFAGKEVASELFGQEIPKRPKDFLGSADQTH